jgi:hypothetical protein
VATVSDFSCLYFGSIKPMAMTTSFSCPKFSLAHLADLVALSPVDEIWKNPTDQCLEHLPDPALELVDAPRRTM